MITASGELKAHKRVNVSPKRQGILNEIFVEEGDQVNKGDLIAKMDFGDLEYRINELRANYETQKASYLRIFWNKSIKPIYGSNKSTF